MLIIREDQMRVFESYMRENFAREMAAHLRCQFPEHPVVIKSNVDFFQFVNDIINSAQTYAIINEFDVRRFAEFLLEYGLDFPKLAWAATILSDNNSSGTEKMDYIDHYTMFELR